MEVRRLRTGDEALGQEAITTLKITDDRVREGFTLDIIRRFLTRDENYLIVALEDNRPIGYVIAYLLDRVDRDRSMMCFYEIGVAEAHRRRGVGTALVERLKACCHEHNVMKMWVQTDRSNTAAVALYQSTGGAGDWSGDEISFGWYW